MDNESLRTELKKCQDALEAQVREGQARDLKYSQLQNTLEFHKIKLSMGYVTYVEEKQKIEKKQKALDALKRKMDAVYEKLATEREKAEKKQQDNIRW